MEIFYIMLSVPQNLVMDLNNVMLALQCNFIFFYFDSKKLKEFIYSVGAKEINDERINVIVELVCNEPPLPMTKASG